MSEYFLWAMIVVIAVCAVITLAQSIQIDKLHRVIANTQWALEHMGAEVYGGGPARALKMCWVHLKEHPLDIVPGWEKEILLDVSMFPVINYNEQQLRKMLTEEKDKNQKLIELNNQKSIQTIHCPFCKCKFNS